MYLPVVTSFVAIGFAGQFLYVFFCLFSNFQEDGSMHRVFMDRTMSDISRTSTRAVLWNRTYEETNQVHHAKIAGVENMYKTVADIINAFDDIGVDTFLVTGSALGARRNHGWFQWDNDADLAVLCTNVTIIEQVLKRLQLIFHENLQQQ